MMAFQTAFFTFFVWVTVTVGPTSACSGSELLGCIAPLDTMSSSQYADPKTVCQEVHQAIDCFEREVKKCPGDQDLLRHLREHFEQMRSMCDKTKEEGSEVEEEEGGKDNHDKDICSSDDIMACVSSLSGDSLGAMDMSMACLEIHKAVECVHKEVDTCPDYLQSYLDDARQQMSMVKDWCEPFHKKLPVPYGPDSSTSLRPSQGSSTGKPESGHSQSLCSWEDIHHCVWPLESTLREGIVVDILTLCRMHEQAFQCLRKVSAHCPESMTPHFWSSQLLFDEINMHCKQITDTAQRPGEKAGQSSDCVQDEEITLCLIHNQMPAIGNGARRKEPLGRDRMCLLVGDSESCMVHKTRNKPGCSPQMVTRMSNQLEEQKAQCKHLGYPINKSVVLLPTTLLTLTVVFVTVILRHI